MCIRDRGRWRVRTACNYIISVNFCYLHNVDIPTIIFKFYLSLAYLICLNKQRILVFIRDVFAVTGTKYYISFSFLNANTKTYYWWSTTHTQPLVKWHKLFMEIILETVSWNSAKLGFISEPEVQLSISLTPWNNVKDN